MKKALYPGSFDPITKGHMNIVEQSDKLFDEIVIAVLYNPYKKSNFFDVNERVEMIKEVYKDNPKIKVISSNGATVDVAKNEECDYIIRGLRTMSDYDYEVQMSHVNKEISNGSINTICFLADKDYQFISSTVIKEVSTLGKDISKYVHPFVQEKMRNKLS